MEYLYFVYISREAIKPCLFHTLSKFEEISIVILQNDG